MKQYAINEIYRTVHGEGVRYGIPHIFVRFARCNLTCGFCDTEFESGRNMTTAEILAECDRLAISEPPPRLAIIEGALDHPDNGPPVAPIRNVLFCGGEPLLQLDDAVISAFKEAGWYTCVETNGSLPCPEAVDWVTCSPKVAEHAIRLQRVDELKYVRGSNQSIPRPSLNATHYLLSPRFMGDDPEPGAIENCVRLVLNNPGWRLTMQHHKQSFGNLA